MRRLLFVVGVSFILKAGVTDQLFASLTLFFLGFGLAWTAAFVLEDTYYPKG